MGVEDNLSQENTDDLSGIARDAADKETGDTENTSLDFFEVILHKSTSLSRPRTASSPSSSDLILHAGLRSLVTHFTISFFFILGIVLPLLLTLPPDLIFACL